MALRQNRFNVSTGIIEVNYPDDMTADDVKDFKDAMAITFRILERAAARGGGHAPQLVPDHNSASGFRVA